MGGTEPSSIVFTRLGIEALESSFECFPFADDFGGVGFRPLRGRCVFGTYVGAPLEGVGGVELFLFVGGASSAGGVGKGGGTGTPFGRCGASDAEDSRRGLVEAL